MSGCYPLTVPMVWVGETAEERDALWLAVKTGNKASNDSELEWVVQRVKGCNSRFCP